MNRTAAILPWHSTVDVERLSPVTVSSRYLSHIVAAWDRQFPESRCRQEVTLTVPAWFDAVARELTVAAAQHAGLQHLVLLEEPQAALYAGCIHTKTIGPRLSTLARRFWCATAVGAPPTLR